MRRIGRPSQLPKLHIVFVVAGAVIVKHGPAQGNDPPFGGLIGILVSSGTIVPIKGVVIIVEDTLVQNVGANGKKSSGHFHDFVRVKLAGGKDAPASGWRRREVNVTVGFGCQTVVVPQGAE